MISILKFSIPTVLLAATGAWMAFVFPAAGWISSVAAKISAALVKLFEFWPSHTGAGSATLVSFAFLAIWVLGSATMFVVWLNRLRRSYNGLTVAPSRELDALDGAKRRLRFRANVGLRSSDWAREPALIGIFRPVVTIPKGLSEGLTLPELETVLLHELAHARRRDNLASAFVHCLVCVFWFHPLLWFVEKRLIAERERACDEMVICCGTNPHIYLTGLAKVCKFHLFAGVAGVSATSGSDLKARFDWILSCRVCKPIPCVIRLVVAGFALLIRILPIAGGYCEQCVSNSQRAPSLSLRQHHVNHSYFDGR
ncbi:MAG: M56 family metallopeptidase [Acidobacteriota bacterium]|nr:M56 family metallopeptidase [Acidobacteriota bacterium]